MSIGSLQLLSSEEFQGQGPCGLPNFTEPLYLQCTVVPETALPFGMSRGR